jgi:hypothetical protein
MHWDILDKKRLDILPKFSFLKKYGFYLAGGTALALHFGHRDSIDFDFFTEQDFNKEEITNIVLENFSEVLKVQDENNTLTFILEGNIKVSFFKYKYKLIEDLIGTDFFDIASVADIACMKLNAICNRNTLKDYVDLFFILKQKKLSELLELVKIKMPELDTLLILKSLIYFEDIVEEPIIFKTSIVSIDEIKAEITKFVLEYQKNIYNV